MDKKRIEVAARLNRMATKADRSISLGFETAMEMTSEEVAILHSYVRSEGYLLFSVNQFQEKDVPKENTPETGKSQSQRMRNVLYVYWKQKGFAEDFELFYKRKMDTIIEMVKEKLLPS